MGLKAPFFDNNAQNAKETLSKLKWENNDSLSEMMIEYMIDFGAEINLQKPESLFDLFSNFFKSSGKVLFL